MKVLVTGSSGFVGKNFVLYLKEKGFDVLTLDAEKNKLFDTDFIYRLGDFTWDSTSHHYFKEKELFEEVECIVHLASQSHVDRAISGPAQFIDDNVRGTLELLEMTRKMKHMQKFILFSTDEVGACLTEGSFLEFGACFPQNVYASTKAAQEHLANSYGKAFGLPLVTTRCVNIFGPHQADEKFLPTIIRNALNDQPIPIYGKGKQVREWVHVDHVMEFVHFVMQAVFIPPGSVLHIAGEPGIQNLHLVHIVLNLLEKSPKLATFVKDRPGHDARYSLGRSEETDRYGLPFYERNFMEDLKATIQWYKEKHNGG